MSYGMGPQPFKLSTNCPTMDKRDDEDAARKCVMGEVFKLEIELRRTYQLVNNYHGGRRLWSSKTNKPVINSIASETEEEEDNFVDDLGSGGSSSSFGSNNQTTNSISAAYYGLKKLEDKLSRNLNVLTDVSYLLPFCEVIKEKDISGPITGLALESLIEFLSCGLIDSTEDLGSAQLIGESVIKARFIGTDHASDEVVLKRILFVLRELIVRGYKSLTNDTVCEIMQSCFRIAFEPRLSELLRETAEQALKDMCRVLFKRIHEFDDISPGYGTVVKISSSSNKFPALNPSRKVKASTQSETNIGLPSPSLSQPPSSSEFVNKQGIKFTEDAGISKTAAKLMNRELSSKNYDLVCIHELLTYLTSLINPLAESQNTEVHVNVGLKLLTVAFKTAVNEIGAKQCLLAIVKNELCWNLLLLLQPDKHLTPFSAATWLSFIIFTSLRVHLKYQLEALFIRLMEIIASVDAPIEFREISLSRLYAFFQHVPHLCHEMFINYDCDPHASNLLEDTLNLMSKNCFTSSTANPIGTSTPHAVPISFSAIQKVSLNTLLACLRSLQKAELKSNEMILKYHDVEVLQFIRAVSNQQERNSPEESTELVSSIPLTSQDTDPSPSSQPSSPQHVDVGTASALVATSVAKSEEPALNEIIIVREQSVDPSGDRIDSVPEDPEVIPVITRRKPTMLYLPKSVAEIERLKQKKKLLWMASEQFNAKPSKGINFLQEHQLIANEKDIVNFLRDNSRLDKKQIGEYLANKKNISILEAFVSSFAFKGIRIDEALRLFLESFRLPGESPLITPVLEQFAHHWFETNDRPFASEDAAFSLAYAIIMLNVEHHNPNAKKQKIPMTCEEFKNMLRDVNGGKDFDPNLLRDIHLTIKNNEIVMPAEQHGIVREKYLWKCLLRRSETDFGTYWFATETNADDTSSLSSSEPKDDDRCLQLSLLNGPIFMILWGPVLSAMTYIFDKINVNQNSVLTRKILNQGFTICALLCAKYGHLDDLVESLCKFTISSAGGPTSPLLSPKSQLAAQCLFSITKEYVNEIRRSWSEIVKMILNWFIAKFLEETLEFEDFALGGQRIKMKRKEKPKPVNKNQNEGSSNFLSSFYSYFAGNPQDGSSGDTDGYQPGPLSGSKDSQDCDCNVQSSELIKSVCKPLSIIEESKFLHIDSLLELIKALIAVEIEMEDEDGDDVEAFRLEMLLQIVLSNRDRASIFWPHVQAYLQRASKICNHSELFSERYISAIFRLAIRFTPRPDAFTEQIYQQMYRMLITFEPKVFQKYYTAAALHSFITHLHSSLVKIENWQLIFDTLLYVGIGYRPQGLVLTSNTEAGSKESINVQSDGEETPHNQLQSALPGRGYTSDSELDSQATSMRSGSLESIGNQENSNPYKLMTGECIGTGKGSVYRIFDTTAYEKCTEVLTLIIRKILTKNIIKTNSAEVNESIGAVTCMAIDTLRKFVEASVKIQSSHNYHHLRRSTSYTNSGRRNHPRAASTNRSRSTRNTGPLIDSEEEFENISETAGGNDGAINKQKLSTLTESCALELLDLMDYLHLNAGFTSDNTANEYLWSSVWCPLLQGIALLCCDSRRKVRTHALTCLQRALLNHDMRILTAHQWESCFNKVLFPLLAKLLEPLNIRDPVGMDETRMRATNLLCKVFLQHLQSLLNLPTFTALWLTILDFMDKYMKTEMQTDLVKEAIPESLKNMLLVMDTANCFNSTLASITWDRIHCFLPNLKDEIMPPQPPPVPAVPQPPPTLLPSPSAELPQSQFQAQYPTQQPTYPEQQQQQEPQSQPQSPHHQQYQQSPVHQQQYQLHQQQFYQQPVPGLSQEFQHFQSQQHQLLFQHSPQQIQIHHHQQQHQSSSMLTQHHQQAIPLMQEPVNPSSSLSPSGPVNSLTSPPPA